jgi:hypothetical protein
MKKVKILRLSLIGIFLAISLSHAFSGYSNYQGSLTVTRIVCDSDGSVCFGTSVKPANTNSCWGLYLQFNSTTTQGKQLLSTLLAAKANGGTIAIWYNGPATTITGNCAEYDLGYVIRIAFE